ncbi:MAG: sugar phosphate nucleotidyltransferase [Elusimicrobiota bacterium]
MMLPVAIPAGGLATRLRPITEKTPKALIDIDGRPFIVRQLELLKKNDIERVVLCVGYRGEMIRDVVGDGHKLGLRVDYSFDWPDLLGTGGALKKALKPLGDEFFVLYGDSYLDCDYHAVQESFKKSGKPALMTVFCNDNKWDKSNISYKDGKILKYDKKNPDAGMRYIDYGLSVLTRAAFDAAGFGDKFDLADLYKHFCDSGQMAGHEVKERFYEIGTTGGIRDLEQHLRDKR